MPATTQFVSHAELAAFAADVVNLRREDVAAYRDQVKRLKDRLAEYINEHPDYSLIKMLNSGSVAKGTALRTINDMDVAVYVRAADAPSDERGLLFWLAERLREAYDGVLKPEQFNTETHCVRVSFRGSGLDVDVVPVLYEGDPDDKGYLIARDTGERVLTSIPLHLSFTQTRKKAHPTSYAQVVRLMKWWVRCEKDRREAFRFKSFMVELLCARLSDQGLEFFDYERALERILTYIVKSGLDERVSFADYYDSNSLPGPTGAAIEMFDPVNPQNNVAALYTIGQREAIVEAATDALDALAEAHYATTKERAVERWKYVFGPSFRV